jgi:hypothetical protein
MVQQGFVAAIGREMRAAAEPVPAPAPAPLQAAGTAGA